MFQMLYEMSMNACLGVLNDILEPKPCITKNYHALITVLQCFAAQNFVKQCQVAAEKCVLDLFCKTATVCIVLDLFLDNCNCLKCFGSVFGKLQLFAMFWISSRRDSAYQLIADDVHRTRSFRLTKIQCKAR